TRWTGRSEPFESERACYWYQLAQPYEQQRIGLVGFACDQGVRRNQGRVGARAAPPLIRSAFAKLPVIAELQQRFNDELQTLLGDAGDIHCDDDDGFAEQLLEQAQQQYASVVSNVIQRSSLPIGLGGGHAMAYGSFLGLWQALQQAANGNTSENNTADIPTTPVIGIINFDAHLDIRQSDVATSG
ncbi:arginase family protein, partial [Psychrobacter immobilis]|uniref:arginase family protein n=2 Tax=Psychrobacter TaxID=497 RepID=UPI00191B1A7F